MRAPLFLALLAGAAPGLASCERPVPREQGALAQAPAAPPGADALPAEIAAFAARREQCDHFRGEEAYDAARGRFLAARLAELCTGSDAALAALKQRHAANRAAAAVLAQFEDRIE